MPLSQAFANQHVYLPQGTTVHLMVKLIVMERSFYTYQSGNRGEWRTRESHLMWAWPGLDISRNRPDLCQSLLALCVPRVDQGLVGLVDQHSRALHDVLGRIQHGCGSLGLLGAGGHTSSCLGQRPQGLGCLPGSYAYTCSRLPWREDGEVKGGFLSSFLH